MNLSIVHTTIWKEIMKRVKKKLVSLLMTGMLLAGALTGCSGAGASPEAPSEAGSETVPGTQAVGDIQAVEDIQTAAGASAAEQVGAAGLCAGWELPKYVFLFIGDGMSYPQVQLTNYFLSASQADAGKTVAVDGEEKTILQSKNHLAMMDFPVAGSAQTFDSTSFAPDSASTATSIATGKKTWSGSINVSEDFTQTYETIAEKLKAQKDYKIGVLSTVNLNHATPAAFYAHQASQKQLL